MMRPPGRMRQASKTAASNRLMPCLVAGSANSTTSGWPFLGQADRRSQRHLEEHIVWSAPCQGRISSPMTRAELTSITNQ